MKNAGRKQTKLRRRRVQASVEIRRSPRRSKDDAGVVGANAELHRLLTERGWIDSRRADGRTMYDWPPSAPNEDHEITYLIVDLRGGASVGPPYRVFVVNGDRLIYEAETALVADLDNIEARRCAGCTTCLHHAAR
jgi:hypothetical protein